MREPKSDYIIGLHHYQEELVYKWIRILFFVGIFLVPLFSVLDYFTTRPDVFDRLLVYRLVVTGIVLLLFLLVQFSHPGRFIVIYGYLFSVFVGGMIAQMTVDLGGYDSSYYAGLNLVLLAVNLIIPWHWLHTVLNGLLLISIYNWLNLTSPQAFKTVNVINNHYFLLSTAFIITIISWLRFTLVKQEYESRARADRSQFKEIQKLAAVAEQISAGDLTANIDFQFESTAGTLLTAFRKMINDLKVTLHEITETSAEVKSIAGSIKGTSAEMAETASRQSLHADDSIREIKQMATRIQDTGSRAREIAVSARDSAMVSKRVNEEIITAMKRIDRIFQVVREFTDRIKELETSSDQIQEVITVIVDIAGQTNMLALNASIEAARAGDQGRGFAVVAEQVGRLAERSGEATRQTGEIIENIRDEIASVIQSMSSSSEEIQSTLEIIRNLSPAVTKIIGFSEQLYTSMDYVVSMGEEHEKSGVEISHRMEEVGRLSQDTAASSEEMATTAALMQSLTERLDRLVRVFKIS